MGADLDLKVDRKKMIDLFDQLSNGNDCVKNIAIKCDVLPRSSYLSGFSCKQVSDYRENTVPAPCGEMISRQ